MKGEEVNFPILATRLLAK